MTKLEILSVDASWLNLSIGFDSEGWEKLDLWKPQDPVTMATELAIKIGVTGEVWSNWFSLFLCTEQFVRENGTVWKPEFTLVVSEFQWQQCKGIIKARVYSCEKETWDKSVQELQKKFYWEYETKRQTIKKLPRLPQDAIPKNPFR